MDDQMNYTQPALEQPVMPTVAPVFRPVPPTNQMIRKDLRRRFNPACWSLVVYFMIMNIVMMAVTFCVTFIQAIWSELGMGTQADVFDSAMSAAEWSYILSVAVGFLILLLWKKPVYFRQEIFARGRPMSAVSFLCLLTVFLSVQLVTSLLNTAIEFVLNLMGLTMMAALESAGGMSDSLPMFLYASILAPITEEILFRGLVQRTLMPYGKKFAVFASAFLFGIFHGNLAQTPFAFMTGLVLGFVAAEYNIVWAMVLHMINNLVLADMLSRLTASLSPEASEAILGIVILILGIAGLVVLIVKRKSLGQWLRQEKINPLCMQSFFSHPAVILLAVLTGVNGLLLFSKL